MPTIFDLPGEVRNQIYEYLVLAAHHLVSTSSFRATRPPAITRVCQQLRGESISMWYSRNLFELPCALYTCDETRRSARVSECPVRKPSSRTSPIGALGHWVQEIGFKQFKYVREFMILIDDEIFYDYSYICTKDWDAQHKARVHVQLAKSGDLTTAKLAVYTSNGLMDFEVLDQRRQNGIFGENPRSFKSGIVYCGCTPFNHFIRHYLSSQEPEVDGLRKVSLDPLWSSEHVVDIWYSYEVKKAANDEGPTGLGYRHRPNLFGPEIDDPVMFYPTSDLFTVLSVLSDAFQYHCCCCLREPATTAPCRSHVPVSSDSRPSINRPCRTSFDDEEYIALGEEDFPIYSDDVNWVAIHGQPSLHAEDEEPADDDHIVHAEPNFGSHQPLVLEGLALAGHEIHDDFQQAWDWVRARRSAEGFHDIWHTARSGAGFRVPQYEQMYPVPVRGRLERPCHR